MLLTSNLTTLAAPFIVNLTIPYPDRLTRFRSEVHEFATQDEAIAFLAAPFQGAISGMVRDFTQHLSPEGGKVAVIAVRHYKKAMVMNPTVKQQRIPTRW